MALFGPPNIEKLKERRDLDGLVKALDHSDLTVRCRAVRAIVVLLRSGAAFEEPTYDRIAERAGPRAVDGLIEVLRSDRDFDLDAALMLGRLGDSRAVEPLIDAFRRTEALFSQSDPELLQRKALWEALANLGDDATGALVATLAADLKSGDEERQHFAVGSLGELDDGRAVDPLIAALASASETVREDAAWALGNHRDPRAVTPLFKALSAGDLTVRYEAARALRKHGNTVVEALGHLSEGQTEALLAIIALDESKDSVLRLYASEAAGVLARFGDRRAVEPLLMAPEGPAQVQAKVGVVRVCVAEGSAAPLVDVLDHEKPELREAAAFLIESWREFGYPNPDVDPDPDSRYPEKKNPFAPIALEPLIAALAEHGPQGRELAAAALGAFDDPRAVEPLVAALGDESTAVRDSAAVALERIGGTQVERALAEYRSQEE